MTRILLLIAALILYGSLYPWEYRPAPTGQSAGSVLLLSWPAKLAPGDFGDIAVNLLLYMPVGLFGFLALERHRHRWLRWIVPGSLGLLLSTSVELLQVYDKTRVSSLLDVLDNTLGAIVGTGLGFFLRDSMTGATFLVLYWLGFQISALCAIVAHKRSAPKLHTPPLDLLALVVAWSLMLYMLAGPAGAVRKSRFAWAGAIAFIGLLIVRGLAPFHLQHTAAHFNWLPFHAMFQSEWIVGLPIFLEKSFYYGSAIWLFRRAGLSMGPATVLVAAILAGIEAVQRYLPGRTPEITDPVLALILGCILWLLERDRSASDILPI